MPTLKGKLVSVGTHHIRKEATGTTALEEFQWDTTLNNNITFVSGQLVKLTYRHSPMNATLESVFLDYRLTNNGAVDVSVLPLWAGGVREMRIYVNNKRVVDWNREEQCRTAWNTTLLTSHDTDKDRDNRYYVQTGQASVLDGTGNFTPVVIPAGESHQFHLNFKDFWEGFSAGLPLNKVGLIEVEINLSSRGDFVCNPPTAVGDLQIDNLLVYSKHKRYMTTQPPQSMGAFTILHKDVDIHQFSPSQHPFGSPEQEFDINISVDFPRRKYITRLILFSRDPSSVEAYRQVDSSWVRSLELLRNGITLLGTEYHLDTERKIYKEVCQYLQRHHSTACPTHPADLGHGESFYLTFVDCSTVQHTQNDSASRETKDVEVNGLDNFSNLVLRIKSNTNVVSATSNLVILLEYNRFDKVMANGSVVKVLEHLA
jgi:hypothetical protein